MTQETFKKLVEEGYVTEVGVVTSYLSSPTSLEKITVKDLADRGFICKQIDCKLWDAYVESQIEEPAEIIEPKEDDDVNPIIAPVVEDDEKKDEEAPVEDVEDEPKEDEEEPAEDVDVELKEGDEELPVVDEE